ncbi:MAG: hydrogen gas-evolving membrane-bound hydrogenase subunit E [candidate division WOR-3 bacterium]|nr:hydrogen gas-evolving membrane-bound hydrogenase subunit E [candidate division WOR-3 bacterium]
MNTLVLLHILLGFMIIGSLVTVEIRNMLSAVISVGAVGFALSIMFLFLGAPDIAITQVIVEILSLILLIRSTINVDNMAIEKRGEHVLSNRASLIFIGIILVFAWFSFHSLRPFGYPSMRVSQFYLNQGLKEVGATNFVTSVILDFRAYDTLGEAMVLFTSISGAFAILRRWKREQHKDFLRIDREH